MIGNDFLNFINGIIHGNISKIGIVDYAKEYLAAIGELDSLLIKMMARTITAHQIVFTGDRGDDGLEDIKDIARISIEQQKQNDRLFEAMGVIEAYKDRLGQPQRVQTPTLLPVELQTDEAIKRFERAEKAGIIVRTTTGYKKNGITKAQLAYFLQRIYQADSQSGAKFPDTELSNLFGESRLGKAAAQLMNNKNDGGKPRGYKIIDDLFLD